MKRRKNVVIAVIAGSTGMLVGGLAALWLRQKRIDFLNKRALYGMDITVLPIDQGNAIGIKIYNLDTDERLGIGLTKESAARIADYIRQIIDGTMGDIEAVVESGSSTKI